MLLELAAVIHDPVTTTDELIPSGETSSYRSNPLKLSEFALSRRCPEYVGTSKRIQADDLARRAGKVPAHVAEALAKVGASADNTSFGSCVFANKPGDGSAREQAASCQKVLGGDANICYEYATKRYRRPSATAPTASTGVSSRSRSRRRPPSTMRSATSCSCRASARPSSPVPRKSTPR